MDNGQNTGQEPIEGGDVGREAFAAVIRDAAFAAWVANREPGQSAAKSLFDKVYLGHYGSVDAYTEDLVDRYELDAKLDAAVVEPFRRHLDIDVTALARWLVANGALYALPAVPVGVWVFNGEIE